MSENSDKVSDELAVSNEAPSGNDAVTQFQATKPHAVLNRGGVRFLFSRSQSTTGCELACSLGSGSEGDEVRNQS
jgi:hypothetical protein